MAQESMSEKVSVNMNVSTLSQIDLLVDHGYYSNRSDFINQAVRQTLDNQRSIVDRIVDRKAGSSPDTWFLGICCVEKDELEKALADGKKKRISGYGLLMFGKDCADELILSSVESIHVRGRVVCSAQVKAQLCLK